ncbi:Solute carrier family 22 member 20 [Chionoecetes opilio]|uniref:Solute carrier family 22 member 20 n=1 Tax=Chionoecetes opilio TaxID=41210 RepID=A0A8J5CYE1_CHIOP|nr:Solute carrier family 22 member 20 [Chionoecetes opilio]
MTDTNKFDDLLTHLGTGRWNMLYFIAASYCIFMHPAQFISGVYLAPAVNHTCLPPEGNESVFISEDSCSYSVVVEGGEEVEEACTEWLFDASVFTNTLTSEFSLVCGRSYLRALYQSVYMLGTFLSPLISGIIADRYGRKVVVAASQVCILVSSLALCFLRTVVAILSVRFILGMFNVLIFTILCLEVCEPKHRGLVCMLLGLPWGLGTMAWGGAAFLIREWRWLQLAVSLPLVLVLPAL